MEKLSVKDFYDPYDYFMAVRSIKKSHPLMKNESITYALITLSSKVNYMSETIRYMVSVQSEDDFDDKVFTSLEAAVCYFNDELKRLKAEARTA